MLKVAPFAGAWIEIELYGCDDHRRSVVAPFAGAWIEIGKRGGNRKRVLLSLPSRERGLKSFRVSVGITEHIGRSLRGSVD